MRLWRFADPYDGAFARAICLGASAPKQSVQGADGVRPRFIEWEPGSDAVGDFTWTGVDLIVAERVGQALLERFSGFGLGMIEMVQDPKLSRPQRITRRTKRRVWLPYEGPPLRQLRPTSWLDVDPARSALTVLPNGQARIEGAEHTELRGRYPDPITQVRVPREPGKGIYIAEEELKGNDIFRLRQSVAHVFCVDEVRRFVIDSRFTNVDFFEMGETFSKRNQCSWTAMRALPRCLIHYPSTRAT